jgi:hypothetical protein
MRSKHGKGDGVVPAAPESCLEGARTPLLVAVSVFSVSGVEATHLTLIVALSSELLYDYSSIFSPSFHRSFFVKFHAPAA